jgi:hypothetical protein
MSRAGDDAARETGVRRSRAIEALRRSGAHE